MLDDIDYQYLENSFSSKNLSTVYQALDEECLIENYFETNNFSSLEDLKRNLGEELIKVDENNDSYLMLPHSKIYIFEKDNDIFINPILKINLGEDNYIDFNMLLYEKYNNLAKDKEEKVM